MPLDLEIALYFIYGLAFFSLGIVLLLESWRLPGDAPQIDLIRPLAAFGLLHGIHEWLDVFLDVRTQLGVPTAPGTGWLRLLLLVGSFAALVVYSYHAIRYSRGHVSAVTWFGIITLPLFALVVSVDLVQSAAQTRIEVHLLADGLARYLVGVPAAAISALGLRAAALKARADHRRPLDQGLNLAALGFAVYSLSQLVVLPMDSVLARLVNTERFMDLTGVPIQVLRTSCALLIAAGLIAATRFLEKERRAHVAKVDAARLAALEQNERLQRELLRRTVQAQESERGRIARELHDELAQTLTALSLDLGTLERSLGEPPKARRAVRRLQTRSRQMALGLDRIMLDLRPALLDRLGLVPALQALCEGVSGRIGGPVQLTTQGVPRRLDPTLETALFRIAQESTTNIVRHAQARRASIRLVFEPEVIRMTVSDDGVGFVLPNRADPGAGWGLVGMRERSEAAGGQMSITSSPGSGTQIEVLIPARAAAEPVT